MVLGVAGVIASTLFMHFAGSWVFLYPLPFHGAGEWGRWASGLFTYSEVAKPSFYSFMLPLAELSNHRGAVTLWGQVRPRSGPQPYLLQRWSQGRWIPVGRVSISGDRGFFTRRVVARTDARFRVWSLLDNRYSPALSVR